MEITQRHFDILRLGLHELESFGKKGDKKFAIGVVDKIVPLETRRIVSLFWVNRDASMDAGDDNGCGHDGIVEDRVVDGGYLISTWPASQPPPLNTSERPIDKWWDSGVGVRESRSARQKYVQPSFYLPLALCE